MSEWVSVKDRLPELAEGHTRKGKRVKLQNYIIALLKEAGRPLTLNEILIGQYRKYGFIDKRNNLTPRVHALVVKGRVVRVKRGHFALSELPKALKDER